MCPFALTNDTKILHSRELRNAILRNHLKWPCSPWVLVAQWIQCLSSVWEVMGSIPFKDSDFSFFPHSCHNNQLTFHISLPKNSPFSIIYYTHDDFDSAEFRSMQGAYHIWTRLNDLACSLQVLVAQWIEHPPAAGHGFDSCWGLIIFLCPTFACCWSVNFSLHIYHYRYHYCYRYCYYYYYFLQSHSL